MHNFTKFIFWINCNAVGRSSRLHITRVVQNWSIPSPCSHRVGSALSRNPRGKDVKRWESFMKYYSYMIRKNTRAHTRSAMGADCCRCSQGLAPSSQPPSQQHEMKYDCCRHRRRGSGGRDVAVESTVRWGACEFFLLWRWVGFHRNYW